MDSTVNHGMFHGASTEERLCICAAIEDPGHIYCKLYSPKSIVCLNPYLKTNKYIFDTIN